MADNPTPQRPRESAETLLAKNLLAARTAAGWTQDTLSAASRISRATIAQLETGVSDPRLSTLAALAAALHLPPSLLLIGEVEVRSLARLGERLAATPPVLPANDIRQLQRWVNSGMLRDRADAVRLAAQRVGKVDGVHPLAVIVAALFAAFLPDPGTTVGAAWGELIAAESAAASASASAALPNGPGPTSP